MLLTQVKVSQIFLVNNKLLNNNNQEVYLGVKQVDYNHLDYSKTLSGVKLNKAQEAFLVGNLSLILDFLHRQTPNHKINLILPLCLGHNPIIYFKIKIHKHQLEVDFSLINHKFKVEEYLVSKLIHRVYFNQLNQQLVVDYFKTFYNLNKLDKESYHKLVCNSKLYKLPIHNF